MAVIIVVLWPAPDPLQGVESVAIEGDAGIASEILNGLLISLEDHEIVITNDPDRADAVLQFVEATSADFSFSVNETGASGTIHAVLLLTFSDGRKAKLDLNVIIDQDGVRGELKGRKFYEIWK